MKNFVFLRSVVVAFMATTSIHAEVVVGDVLPRDHRGITAGGHPAEGTLDPFLGEPRLEVQQIFTGERFPTIVVAVDGSVLATWGAATVRGRRSVDAGKNWGPEILIGPGWQGGGAVVDENTGDILVMVEDGHPPGAPVTFYRSSDHGESWIDEEVVLHPDVNGRIPSMHTNEHGITLRHGEYAGRLLRPSRSYGRGNNREFWPEHYTNAMYSDDGGKSWHTSAPFPAYGTGEAAVAELSDGRIYYNSRRHLSTDGLDPRKRHIAWSEDGGETWKDLSVSDVLPDGPQNIDYGLMAGLVRLPVAGKDILIFSNVDSPGKPEGDDRGWSERRDGTVWVSFDGGQTWPLKRLVYEGPFSYSSLAAGRPGTPSEGWMFLQFEGGPNGAHSDGHVARFNLSWLLGGEPTGDGEVPSLLLEGEPVSLFDGETLDGWEIRPGEEKWWGVKDGAITGGSLDETVPHNTFLTSSESYENFELRFKIRFVEGTGFQNSGLQIRSVRMEDSHEMIGYQVDAGIGYWGDIYDESRRNTAIARPIDPEALADAVKDWGWNDYRILCEGRRIRTWINGELAHDFIETDRGIPRDGFFGLQAHSGGRFLVQMKDVWIRELPSTPGAPTWANPNPEGIRTPEEQRSGFTVPEGFSVELVASEEEGVGKPITVTWDRHGRMWTMTAYEYPVDANEDEAAAKALFARGGSDQVLVFDEPNGSGPQTPRIFADGLAIPLGLLPLADGALVQYGQEIRRYVDSNNDGTADEHEVVLEGFGIQDSHLFPHQFERAPGGWIFVAQGLFNYSSVRRPGGLEFSDGSTSIRFDQCKLARFKPDGSAFELLTAGPNNIWGLSFSRTGETFIQEANDMGYPVAEFAPGTHYPGGSREKLRDDAPYLPQSTRGAVMGGTGLSGLALAEDEHTPFAKGFGNAKVFYVVNPITSKIQIVTLTRDEKGHPVYRKESDFMLSDDPWFRPVAAHFGPDGALYIVDWYNKIISHNEVSRTHPDRDKTRGRIWRVSHSSQESRPRVDLTLLSDDELMAKLGGASARLSSQSWQEIVDRNATSLADPLVGIITDIEGALARRVAALWALEGLGKITVEVLEDLAQAPEQELRHEAVRIAGESSLPEDEFLAVFAHLENESHFRVRAAIANALRHHTEPEAAMMLFAARLGLEPLFGPERWVYDRNFERYLTRWAMATHPEATRQMLQTTDLPVEARLLAVRSFEDSLAAIEVIQLLPEITRPLIPDELALLGNQLSQPLVLEGLSNLLSNPQRREVLLRAMSLLDPSVAANPALARIVGDSTLALLEEERTDERERLAIQLARRFRLPGLASEVARWLQAPERTVVELAEGLAALREAGGATLGTFRSYLTHADDSVRREALVGFGRVDDPAVVSELAQHWDSLPGSLRSLAVEGMSSSASKAAVFAQTFADGRFPGLDETAIDRMIAVLGIDHPAITRLLEETAGIFRPVIQLDGQPEGRVMTNITLDGPFTIEGWIRLSEGIGNEDSVFGRRGGPDLNFYDGRLRLYGGQGAGDRIIASRPVRSGEWFHWAITRDTEERLTLFLNGERDSASGGEFGATLSGLNLGESVAAGGSAASYDEVRVWNRALSEEVIRLNHRTRFTPLDTPPGLVARIGGEDPGGTLEGGARVTLTRDFPELVTPSEALALEEKFSLYSILAERAGDSANGKRLAQASCLICHQVNGEGIPVGPDLSGAGAMGSRALLRNILTPNAQLESGYYRHDLKMKDGSVLSGFLAAESADSITLRQIGADERVIARDQILTHEISRRSLMPEGLIDHFTEDEVADLFTYLRSLQ